MCDAASAGKLLVARPQLMGSIFGGAVLLILDHNADGTVAVILNQPIDVSVTDILEPWGDLVSQPNALFCGGPVAPNGAICLASLTNPTYEPLGYRFAFGEIGIVHLDTPVEILSGAFRDARIFAGYAGWDPGQLEAELDDEAWWLVDYEYEDVFNDATTNLWRDVLRRQKAPLCYYANWPQDPGKN